MAQVNVAQVSDLRKALVRQGRITAGSAGNVPQLPSLQSFQVRSQVPERIFERAQAFLRARQITAATLFLERHRGLENILSPERGHRAF